MLNLGLSLGSVAVRRGVWRPDWVPPSASGHLDFVNDRYWVGGAVVTLAEAASYSRAGTAFARDAANSYQNFGANAVRRTDAGLLVEPASTRKSTYPRTPFTNWVKTGAAATAFAGTFFGVFSNAATLTSNNGNDWNRAYAPDTASIGAGTPVGFTAIYKAGTSGNVILYFWNSTASQGSTIWGAVGSISVSTETAGAITGLSEVALGDGWYEATGTITLASTGAIGFGIGPRGATGQTVVALGGWLETGAPSSIILGTESAEQTRAADAMTLNLPSGAHDLTFTFDDTTQVVAGQSGGYAVPTNLNRRVIKSVTYQPA